MFATFAQKSDLVRHEDREAVTCSQLWQECMDNKVAIARIHAHGVLDTTNAAGVASSP